MPAQQPRPFFANTWRFPAFALCFAALTIYLGYFADRNHFPSFIAAYGAFFALYAWVCFFQKGIPPKPLIALGIGLRVLLLFSLPNLSDDYLRFLWDGRLTIAGYHPFLHPPDYFIDNQILPKGITPELFNRLNSPHYFTVYPPVCQVVFAVAAWIAPENNWLGVVVMKLFLLACEIGTLRIFQFRIADCGLRIAGAPGNPKSAIRNQKSEIEKSEIDNPPAALLYALNPLIILEIVGNCHFEGVMVFFLVAGMMALWQEQVIRSGILWALATASKMLPLLFLPVVWRWLGWRRGLRFNLTFAIATVVLFAPLIAVLPNIVQSLNLYFQKFQFNASIYYIVRAVGYSKTGWDIGEQSGPWLALVTVLGVLLIALGARQKKAGDAGRLASAMLFALFLYLSFAAVVQPWYVCVPLAISLFTRWRFALLWSGLAALSYSHYDGGLRQEHFGLIALEYGALWGGLIAEFGFRNPDFGFTHSLVQNKN